MTEVALLMTAEHQARTLTEASIERLRRCAELRVIPITGPCLSHESLDALATVDAIITGTGTPNLDNPVLDAAPGLRAIIHAAGTLRPIVGVEVYDRGISLSSQAAANALPVAEYTLAMILLELKGVPAATHAYRTAQSEIDVDALLAHSGNYRRKVGIVSASHIGRRLITLLHPFDLEVSVYDPYLSEEDAHNLEVKRVGLTELMRESDLISVHAPLLPQTVGLLGEPELELMRNGAILINTARGAIVDESALIRRLQTGTIRAVIDVTDPEVPPPNSPLWTCPNLTLTPHVAGSRGLELHRIGERAVDEVERFTMGEPFRYGVPRERYATNA